MNCLNCKVFEDRVATLTRVGTVNYVRLNNQDKQMVKKVLYVCDKCNFTFTILEKED